MPIIITSYTSVCYVYIWLRFNLENEALPAVINILFYKNQCIISWGSKPVEQRMSGVVLGFTLNIQKVCIKNHAVTKHQKWLHVEQLDWIKITYTHGKNQCVCVNLDLLSISFLWRCPLNHSMLEVYGGDQGMTAPHGDWHPHAHKALS